MNSLILLPDDIRDNDLVTLVGIRASSLFREGKLVPGKELSIAFLGGEKGVADILKCSETQIILRIRDTLPSLPLQPIDLVVGLSRPQTVKKVIQAGVMSGVRSIHLVHTEFGEKSYLTASALNPPNVLQETVKALEQIGEGFFPQVKIHRSFGYFCRNHLPSLGEGNTAKLLAHPGGVSLMCGDTESVRRSIVLAVGSERGWSDSELGRLKDSGFRQIGLGPRVMRVEVALSFLLGQLQLLRNS